ncbi:MAG TPA: copper resistance protein B [Persephonella sp.]|nr:copper resistance protein B [Persephonella sp.]
MGKKLYIILISIIFMSYFSLSEDVNQCNFYPVKPKLPYYYGQFLIDRFEYILNKDNDFNYEMTAWYGGDYRRIWLELEGEHNFNKNLGKIENGDLLFGKLISPFWDIRAGIGYVSLYNGKVYNDKKMILIGFKGLAPYRFEIDTNLRLTDNGNVYGDFEAEYDLFITQRLVLQPRFDTTFSFKNIPNIDIYSGVNNFDFSLRLRYEFKREFAPYVGLNYSIKIGNARKASEENESLFIFTGIRAWF